MVGSSLQPTTPGEIAPPFAVAMCFPDIDVAVLVAENLGDRPAWASAPHHAAWPAFLHRVLNPHPLRRLAPAISDRG